MVFSQNSLGPAPLVLAFFRGKHFWRENEPLMRETKIYPKRQIFTMFLETRVGWGDTYICIGGAPKSVKHVCGVYWTLPLLCCFVVLLIALFVFLYLYIRFSNLTGLHFYCFVHFAHGEENFFFSSHFRCISSWLHIVHKPFRTY